MSKPMTNESALVEMAVSGVVTTPAVRPGQYIPHPDGTATVLPGMYGITYNVRCGDRAFGWAGDHVEPGVSIDDDGNSGRHHALHYLNCIGNDALVTSGMAAGAKGVVVGEHARILVQFDNDAYDGMAPGDRIQVMTLGQGLVLTDYPGVALKKMSPRLFHALGITEDKGRLHVNVAMELPIRIMGSGAELNSEYVDQDLMSAKERAEWQLIRAALEETDSKKEAAERLGISPRTLRHKLQKWKASEEEVYQSAGNS